MSKVNFSYIEDTGNTICSINYKNLTFYGTAACCLEDKDFQSEKTGCFIAEARAIIRRLQFLRRESKYSIKVLEDFQKVLQSCKESNNKSFEARRLRKEIYLKKKKLQELENVLQDEKEYLKQYINNKDKFYKQQRIKRGQNT